MFLVPVTGGVVVQAIANQATNQQHSGQVPGVVSMCFLVVMMFLVAVTVAETMLRVVVLLVTKSETMAKVTVGFVSVGMAVVALMTVTVTTIMTATVSEMKRHTSTGIGGPADQHTGTDQHQRQEHGDKRFPQPAVR